MKVVHILNSLATGGAEKLILDTIPLYNKSGVVADVIVFKNDNYAFHAALEDTNSCKIYNFSNSSVYNPISIFKMMKILKHYDIAHVHLFPAQYFVVMAKLLSFSKIKLVYTEHNTTNRRLENKFFKAVDKWSYTFYTKIVAISTKIEELLREHTGFKGNRIVVIQNGVAIQNIVEAKPISRTSINDTLTEADKLIIQVAGFREQKDQACLIKAMALLPQECKLLLVGEGVTKSKCQELVHTLKLENRAFFLGIRTDIPNLLKTADVVVLSSHFEGMSLSSIEGMASGKPFVASNVPGLQEMVEGHGILFDESNEKQLANIIANLIENQSYYKEVAEACVLHAKKFDIQIMVQNHLKLYKDMLNA